MVYRGIVKNGVIVLFEEADLPDGTKCVSSRLPATVALPMKDRRWWNSSVT